MTSRDTSRARRASCTSTSATRPPSTTPRTRARYVSTLPSNETHHRPPIPSATHSTTYGVTETTYGYDPLTFRLFSLTTTRHKKAGGDDVLQSLSYIYDAVGNIVEITDE